MSPRNQTVPEGKETNINCMATGVPKPTLAWKFKDGDLPSGAIVNDTEEGSLLQLSSVTKGMEGTYTCTAENKANAIVSIATLHVIGNISLMFSSLFIFSKFGLSKFITVNSQLV